MDVSIERQAHPNFPHLKWRYEIPQIHASGYKATKSGCEESVKKLLKRLNEKGNWVERGGFCINPNKKRDSHS